jgi:hypothetical protein
MALPRHRRGVFSFHDLRQSHATRVLVSNVHPKVIFERLGHGKVGIASDLYGRGPHRAVDVARDRRQGDRAAVQLATPFRSPPWHFAGAKNITPNETRALAIIRLGGPSGCAHLD